MGGTRGVEETLLPNVSMHVLCVWAGNKMSNRIHDFLWSAGHKKAVKIKLLLNICKNKINLAFSLIRIEGKYNLQSWMFSG